MKPSERIAKIQNEKVINRDHAIIQYLDEMAERTAPTERVRIADEIILDPEPEPSWKHPASINAVRVDVQERAREEDMILRDAILNKMDTRIKGLVAKLERADPIVQQVVSQGPGSMTLGMVQDMHRRLTAIECELKGLPAPESTPRVVSPLALAPSQFATVKVDEDGVASMDVRVAPVTRNVELKCIEGTPIFLPGSPEHASAMAAPTLDERAAAEFRTVEVDGRIWETSKAIPIEKRDGVIERIRDRVQLALGNLRMGYAVPVRIPGYGVWEPIVVFVWTANAGPANGAGGKPEPTPEAKQGA